MLNRLANIIFRTTGGTTATPQNSASSNQAGNPSSPTMHTSSSEPGPAATQTLAASAHRTRLAVLILGNQIGNEGLLVLARNRQLHFASKTGSDFTLADMAEEQAFSLASLERYKSPFEGIVYVASFSAEVDRFFDGLQMQVGFRMNSANLDVKKNVLAEQIMNYAAAPQSTDVIFHPKPIWDDSLGWEDNVGGMLERVEREQLINYAQQKSIDLSTLWNQAIAEWKVICSFRVRRA